MVTINEIPLSPESQTFSIPLYGTTYNLTVFWNNQLGNWVLNIADSNSNPIISGIPLVTGCDLLEQYAYVDIGGELRVQTDNNPDAIPTSTNLGTNSHLYFVTNP